jgi:rare lipoprotein A
MIEIRPAPRADSHIAWVFLLPIVLLSGCATFGWFGPRAPEREPVDLTGLRMSVLEPDGIEVAGADAEVVALAMAAFPPDTAMVSARDLISFLENARARQLGTGVASYYGRAFAGRRTASGEIFNPAELTAAHRSLPFGSRVRVTNPRNGRAVVVRINDRGPFTRGRVINLSHAAAREIGMIRSGTAQVVLELIPEIADLRERSVTIE